MSCLAYALKLLIEKSRVQRTITAVLFILLGHKNSSQNAIESEHHVLGANAKLACILTQPVVSKSLVRMVTSLSQVLKVKVRNCVSIFDDD